MTYSPELEREAQIAYGRRLLGLDRPRLRLRAGRKKRWEDQGRCKRCGGVKPEGLLWCADCEAVRKERLDA